MTEAAAFAEKAAPRLRFRVAPPGGLEPPTHGLGNPSTLRCKCVRVWQLLETPSGATPAGDVGTAVSIRANESSVNAQGGIEREAKDLVAGSRLAGTTAAVRTSRRVLVFQVMMA